MFQIGEFRSRAAVMDLAFAHDPNSAVLALVNVFGDLSVLKIVGSSEADKIETLFTFRVACRFAHYHYMKLYKTKP